MRDGFEPLDRKELKKISKEKLIEGIHNDYDRVNKEFNRHDEIIKMRYEENVQLNKTIEEMIKIDEIKNKDISIMQQALNDVEEKNRALNIQLTDLRKALKTASQYL